MNDLDRMEDVIVKLKDELTEMKKRLDELEKNRITVVPIPMPYPTYPAYPEYPYRPWEPTVTWCQNTTASETKENQCVG